jgi:hypothetical protein
MNSDSHAGPNVESINTLLDGLKELISEYVSLSQDIKAIKTICQ